MRISDEEFAELRRSFEDYIKAARKLQNAALDMDFNDIPQPLQMPLLYLVMEDIKMGEITKNIMSKAELSEYSDLDLEKIRDEIRGKKVKITPDEIRGKKEEE
jgi:hypothetical protein